MNSDFFSLLPTHWRLCEVFCILQNLLMCEVPERASDGKASSAIWREPEGISPDRAAAWRSGGFSAQNFLRSRKFKFSTNVHTKSVRPHYAKPLLVAGIL